MRRMPTGGSAKRPESEEDEDQQLESTQKSEETVEEEVEGEKEQGERRKMKIWQQMTMGKKPNRH